MLCDCFFKVKITNYKQGTCEVCRLVDNSVEIKPVSFCDFCQVNICEDCNGKYTKRVFAALIKKFKE